MPEFTMFIADEADRMRQAFDSAWETIEASKSSLADAASAEHVRERLALTIIELSRSVGTSVDELRNVALERLGFVAVDIQLPPALALPPAE